MKIIDIIRLAKLNILSNLKMAISIIFGFIIIMEIVMVSTGYGYSMNNYIEGTINNSSSSRYCYSVFSNFKDSEIEEFRKNSNIEGVQILKNYDIYKFCQDNNKVINATPLANDEVSMDAAVLKLDGKMYNGENDFTYIFNLDSSATATRTMKIVKYKIGVIEGEDNLQFSKSELLEYENKYDKSSPFLAGGEFSGENQIIITDYMLEKFGVDSDSTEYIGKKISLYVDTKEGELCLIDNYEICGIIDSRFYFVNSRKSMPQILVSNANKEYLNISHERVFGNSFRDIVKFYNNNYVESMYMDKTTVEYSEVETLQLLFNEVVLLICIILIVAVIVFVYIMIYFYFKKRTRYVCIQKAMGMSGGKLYSLIFFELLIMGIVATIIAIPVYYGVLQILNDVIGMVVSNSFMVTQDDFVVAICCALVFMGLLKVIVSRIEYCKTKKYTVVNRDRFM